MQFLTPNECDQWLIDRSRSRPNTGVTQANLRIRFPVSPYKFYSWCNSLTASITFRQPCLLWIAEFGIWPSSENWPMYYRLRNALRDPRNLDEAPGHLFAGNEADDLTSFLQLSMLFGWGGYLLTEANAVNAFFSHDEYIDIYSDYQDLMDDFSARLANGVKTSG